MFFPWYHLAMLVFESNSVVIKRLAKIGRGGLQSLDEMKLMVSEKTDAAFEAATATMNGATTADVIDRYRVHVAANDLRLSA